MCSFLRLNFRENHWVASENVKSFLWLPEHQAFPEEREEKKREEIWKGRRKNLLSPVAPKKA